MPQAYGEHQNRSCWPWLALVVASPYSQRAGRNQLSFDEFYHPRAKDSFAACCGPALDYATKSESQIGDLIYASRRWVWRRSHAL